MIDRQSNVKSDQGGEFSSTIAQDFLNTAGIIHQESPRHTPELNGVAERFNRTIKEMISAMVDGTGLGHKYWDYAAQYACCILNMSTHDENARSAWTTLTGRAPNLDNVREFGELVTAVIPEGIRNNSSFETPRAELGRVLGIPQHTSGWMISIELDGKVLASRDIRPANLQIDQPIAPQSKTASKPTTLPASDLPR